MSKRSALVMGLFAQMTTGMAIAVTYPIPGGQYDQWQAINGNIGMICPSGHTCTTVSSNPGFLQTNIQNNLDGKVYLQTIITGATTSGSAWTTTFPFKDESYLLTGQPTGSVLNGLADKQEIHTQQISPTSNTTFNMVTKLHNGWALSTDPLVPAIDLSQTVSEITADVGYGKVIYQGANTYSFTMQADVDADNNRLGYDLRLNQYIKTPGQYWSTSQLNPDYQTCTTDRRGNIICVVLPFGPAYEAYDELSFALVGKAGTRNPTGATNLPFGTGNTVSWAAGDTIRLFAIGTEIHLSEVPTGAKPEWVPGDPNIPGYEIPTYSFITFENYSAAPAARKTLWDWTSSGGLSTNLTTATWASLNTNSGGVFGTAPAMPIASAVYDYTVDPSTADPTQRPVDAETVRPVKRTALFTPSTVGPKQTGSGMGGLTFGQWSVAGASGGDISLTCQTGFTCQPLAKGPTKGPGINQQILVAADGTNYIQSVITDASAAGQDGTIPDAMEVPFATETFVRRGVMGTSTTTVQNNPPEITTTTPNTTPAAPGMANKTWILARPTTTGLNGLRQISTIRTGWAADLATAINPAPNVEITQQLHDAGFVMGSFYSDVFTYKGNIDANMNTTGSYIRLEQLGRREGSSYNPTIVGGDPITGTGYDDVSQFAYAKLAGDMVPSAGLAYVDNIRNPPRNPPTGCAASTDTINFTNNCISWTAGQEIRALMFHGNYDSNNDPTRVGIETFSLTAMDNMNDLLPQAHLFDYSVDGLAGWSSIFGPNPVIVRTTDAATTNPIITDPALLNAITITDPGSCTKTRCSY